LESQTIDPLHYKGSWLGLEGEPDIRVIDTPGLSDSRGLDEDHILSIINFMKKEVGRLDLLVLTFNGQDERLDEGSINNIKIFCDSFGEDQVFKNLLILTTHWSYSSDARWERKKKNINEKLRKEWFIQKLKEKFPRQKAAIDKIPLVFMSNMDFAKEIEMWSDDHDN